jgi:hypothetical protein
MFGSLPIHSFFFKSAISVKTLLKNQTVTLKPVLNDQLYNLPHVKIEVMSV